MYVYMHWQGSNSLYYRIHDSGGWVGGGEYGLEVGKFQNTPSLCMKPCNSPCTCIFHVHEHVARYS